MAGTNTNGKRSHECSNAKGEREVSKEGTVNIHGKEYITVAKRVHDFRSVCTIKDGWGIITHLVTCTDQLVVMRAEIHHPTGGVVATGYAEEVRSSSSINRSAALENCETSAVGRALAAAGFGGSQYASADELKQKLMNHPRHKHIWSAEERAAAAIVEPDSYAAFCKGLTERMVRLEEVQALCRVKQWGNPRAWSRAKREKFLAALDAGTIEELQ